MRARVALGGLLLGAALAACTPAYTREDGIRDLQVELDIDAPTATCFVDEIESEGLTIREVVTDGNVDDPEVIAAVQQAAGICLRDATADRAEFIAGFVATSGLSETVAECTYDSLTANGISVAELLAVGATETVDAEFNAALGAAVAACTP